MKKKEKESNCFLQYNLTIKIQLTTENTSWVLTIA